MKDDMMWVPIIFMEYSVDSWQASEIITCHLILEISTVKLRNKNVLNLGGKWRRKKRRSH